MRLLNRQRRDFFRYMVLLGLAGFSAAPLQAAKLAKNKVQYQETPKDDQKCKDCLQFLSKTSECKLVEGSINSDGWCSLFVLKS
ncbi:MAG: high-potential iron-sulfur protein [Thiovulaceae bacterium]|nr:high-potential iron-sulfur protein [Sulfurimonadaceae bacterium]